MNRLKTKSRNRLELSTLDQLMRISNEAPLKYIKKPVSKRERFVKDLDIAKVVRRFRRQLPENSELHIR